MVLLGAGVGRGEGKYLAAEVGDGRVGVEGVVGQDAGHVA
jgi:hypothetical protein